MVIIFFLNCRMLTQSMIFQPYARLSLNPMSYLKCSFGSVIAWLPHGVIDFFSTVNQLTINTIISRVSCFILSLFPCFTSFCEHYFFVYALMYLFFDSYSFQLPTGRPNAPALTVNLPH